MIDTADILRKAAEDVQPGVWCQGAMFHEEDGHLLTQTPGAYFDLDRALASKRCAVGSIAIATQLLGGNYYDYQNALQRLSMWIDLPEGIEPPTTHAEHVVITFNDYVLDVTDPVGSGARLAELMRTAADCY